MVVECRAAVGSTVAMPRVLSIKVIILLVVEYRDVAAEGRMTNSKRGTLTPRNSSDGRRTGALRIEGLHKLRVPRTNAKPLPVSYSLAEWQLGVCFLYLHDLC